MLLSGQAILGIPFKNNFLFVGVPLGPTGDKPRNVAMSGYQIFENRILIEPSHDLISLSIQALRDVYM
jgi:hypothetical protein